MNKQRILIVDDDPALMRLVRIRLAKRDGYDVHIAPNGERALEVAIELKPDLILLDWKMPGISGLEVLRKLKKLQEMESTAFIMMTSCNLIGDLEQAFALGADSYLIKPVRLELLSQKVKETLRQQVANDSGLTSWLSSLKEFV